MGNFFFFSISFFYFSKVVIFFYNLLVSSARLICSFTKAYTTTSPLAAVLIQPLGTAASSLTNSINSALANLAIKAASYYTI